MINPHDNPVQQQARAKVNLTLKVLGRLPNGYHALQSVVAFADVSDTVTLRPSARAQTKTQTDDPIYRSSQADHRTIANADLAQAKAPAVQVVREDGTELEISGNLIDAACAHLRACDPGLIVPSVTLTKRLPIAAGIGGGSADAAAFLRLVRDLNGDRATSIDWMGVAATLGADVPVCLLNQPAFMTGVGEQLTPLQLTASLPAVLVTPACAVPATKTRDVFHRLGATEIMADAVESANAAALAEIQLHTINDVVDAGENSLAAPAIKLMPEVETALSALEATDEVDLVRLSGAGPTVFALYADGAAARAAAHAISDRHPTWWVRATTLS